MLVTISQCDKCGNAVDPKDIVKHNNRIIYRHKDLGIMLLKEQTSGTGRDLLYSMILCPSCAAKLALVLDKFMANKK